MKHGYVPAVCCSDTVLKFWHRDCDDEAERGAAFMVETYGWPVLRGQQVSWWQRFYSVGLCYTWMLSASFLGGRNSSRASLASTLH